MSRLELESTRLAQRRWEAAPLANRLRVLGRFRRLAADGARELAERVPTRLAGALSRTVADTLVSEVLPLIEACRFLDRESGRILRTRELGGEGRPVWLGRVEAQVERAPWGVVLVIAAANYPLLLAGVQTVQALVAGNAVIWKPAPGTEAVAFAMRTLLLEAGLEPELLTVLDASVAAAEEAIAARVDFVAVTGSPATGRAVLRQLAETVTPAVLELSGCDAVMVLPGADLRHVVEAMSFGLRFNGSFTCMAPRRILLAGLSAGEADFVEAGLTKALAGLKPVELSEAGRVLLGDLVEDARAQGATVAVNGLREGEQQAGATLVLGATPAMVVMRSEVFAPVVSVMRTASVGEAIAADAVCPFGLTAAIFGREREARAVAGRLRVGNVLINDVIAPTADCRVSFGGRGGSGYGVTRGAEGLLAMTTPKTIQVRRGRPKRAYEVTGDGHIELFAGLTQLLHGGWGKKFAGLRRLMAAARNLQ